MTPTAVASPSAGRSTTTVPDVASTAGRTAAAALTAGSVYGRGARIHSQIALTATATTTTTTIGGASRGRRSPITPSPIAASNVRQKANAAIRCGGNHRPMIPAGTARTLETDHATQRRALRPGGRG